MFKIVSFLRSIFGNYLSFFSDIFDRKVALRLAWVTFIVGMLAVFVAAINGLFALIAISMPAIVSIPASWVVPENLDDCLGAYFAAKTAVFVYSYKYKVTSHLSGAL